MLQMEPIRRSQLTSQVIDRVKQYIQANHLQAGTRLPGERELARTLGVSRNVTREAVRALQATGILDIQPGNGAFVANFDYKEIAAHLNFAIGRQDHQFKHWVEARIVLERSVLDLAARKITPEQVQRLEAAIRRMECAESYEADAVADVEFHCGLVEITENPVLIELMSFLNRFFQEARRFKGERFGGADGHRQILDALQRGDGQEAGRLMEEHLRRWNQMSAREEKAI